MRIGVLCFVSAFAVAMGSSPISRAQTVPVKTPAEESQYSRYSQHDDVARFLEAVGRLSREMKVLTIGRIDATKDFPGANLYLVVLTKEGVDSPQKLDRRKPTIMMMAAQHGNEQSAKEAVLALIRDLAVGELEPLLDQLNLLIVPQSNPYGNFVDRRQNEQDLDLNRDHVKLEASSTRALHAVFTRWTPEVTLDVHEKGDDYYRVSTGCVSNLNIHPSLQRFSRETLLAATEKSVNARGYTWHEYLVTEELGSTSAAGTPDREPEVPREMLTRYSTTDLNDGRNGFGIYETLSFIQEGASRHDTATLKDRTGWQYAGIRGLIEAVAAHRKEVLALVGERRAGLLRRAKALSADNVVYMRMEYVRDPAQPELVIKQFEQGVRSGSGQAATGQVPEPKPGEEKVVTSVVKNWFPKVESTLAVPRALGYVVPAAHQNVIRTLGDHGIRLETFTEDTSLEVEAYEVIEVVPAKEDYVAPEKIQVEKKTIKVKVAKGDYYVTGAQPSANLVSSLLEPQSEYGLIRYQAYKLLPEAGARFPLVRLVKGARLPLVRAEAR
jgi:hypothetical protein